MEFCLTKPTHLWRIIQFTKIVAGELCVVVKAIYIVKKNWIENNLCGGFRIIFNGKGNVLTQKCDFVENVGPTVYPAAANELCGMEREYFAQVSAAPAHCKVPVPLFLRFIVEDTSLNCESVMEFKSPVPLDNRVSDVSETMFDVKRNLCSACCKKLDSDLIECPRCHIARYCNKECFDKRKSVHYSICESILEANKEKCGIPC